MTKATSETMKLNFITDQGSTRATVRCACRAVRFGCATDAFGAPPRALPGRSPAVGLPGPASGVGGSLAAVPDRRNVRAGDDGDCGGGSGISHANAAGETDGGSADAGRLPAGAAELTVEAEPAREAGPEPEAAPDGTVPDGTVPDGPVPDDTVPAGSSPAGFTADSAG